jgi:tetratricopeptide (TPR) repeat protein
LAKDEEPDSPPADSTPSPGAAPLSDPTESSDPRADFSFQFTPDEPPTRVMAGFVPDEAPTLRLLPEAEPTIRGVLGRDEFDLDSLPPSARPTRPLSRESATAQPGAMTSAAPAPRSTAPPVAGPASLEPGPTGLASNQYPSTELPRVRRPRTARWVLTGLSLLSVAIGIALVSRYSGARLEPAASWVRARFVPHGVSPPDTHAARVIAKSPPPPAAASATETAPAPSEPAPSPDGIVQAQSSAPSCEALLERADSQALPAETSAAAALARARELAQSGELYQAERVYCRARVEHPEVVAIRAGLLELLLDRRDRLAAARLADELVRAFPRDQQLAWLVGDAWAQNGEFARARTLWLGAATSGSGSDEQRAQQSARQELNLARTAAHAGRFERAAREYRRAAILDPSGAEAPAGVATMLLRMNDAPSATAWAKRAIEQAPKSAALHLLLGDACQAAGDTAAAEEAWRRALEIDPGQRLARDRLRGRAARAREP